MCVYLAAILTLGAGCGIPEPIYGPNTNPKIIRYYPDSPRVGVLRTGSQTFTMCAEDPDGDPIDYYWRINIEADNLFGQDEMTFCSPNVGTTFSLGGNDYPDEESIEIHAVAEDTHGLSSSILWKVEFK